jgi:hypothetical protein
VRGDRTHEGMPKKSYDIANRAARRSQNCENKRKKSAHEIIEAECRLFACDLRQWGEFVRLSKLDCSGK